MNLPLKFVALSTIVIILLVFLLYFFNFFSTTSEVAARNIFSQGCLKYCEEIKQSQDSITEAINKSESLEGSEFMKACRMLNQDIKYNWQCWNRGCCEF